MQLQPILSLFLFLMRASSILAAPEPQSNGMQPLEHSYFSTGWIN